MPARFWPWSEKDRMLDDDDIVDEMDDEMDGKSIVEARLVASLMS